MELHLEDAKLMKSIIDPMIPVGEDLYIEISKDGFRANCKGIANAWSTDAVLRKVLFSKIEVEGTETYYLKLKDFAEFMKTVQNDDKLVISENKDKGALELILSSDQTKMTKKISIRLQTIPDSMKIFDTLAIRKKHTENPNMLTSSSDIQTELFSQAIKAAELGGQEVSLINKPKGLKFEAKETNKSAEAFISYDSEYVDNVVFEDKKAGCEAIYKLEYLRHISRIGKVGDTLSLWMLNQGPLILLYSFQENAKSEQVGYIGFAIAPRVKSDS